MKPLYRRKGQEWWALSITRAMYLGAPPLEVWLAWRDWFSWMSLVDLAVAGLIVRWGIRTERQFRERRRQRWEDAAAHPDPVGFLAGHDYMDKLTSREAMEFVDWWANYDRDSFEIEDLADAPPVVLGYIRAVTTPPRE